MAKKSLSATIQGSVQKTVAGSLKDYKKNNGLLTNTQYKPTEYIVLSEAFSKTTGLKGIPKGLIMLLMGHSDTGKSTALFEAAIACQQQGVLPVIIMTEMKFSWQHLIDMGFEAELLTNEDGEVIGYDGFFLYVDRSSLRCIEDVAKFINDTLKDQKAGALPYDLCFLWDSIGSIPSLLSVEKSTNNNEWNAGAMSAQFGNHINQQIMLSRKEGYPYTNTMVCVNKAWVQKAAMPGAQPSLKPNGGMKMWFDAAIVLHIGGTTSAGTMKLKAQKDSQQVEWGKRTKIAIAKNHHTNTSVSGTIITTAHGFIEDTPASIAKYKKEHSHEWLAVMGTDSYDDVTESEETGAEIVDDSE